MDQYFLKDTNHFDTPQKEKVDMQPLLEFFKGQFHCIKVFLNQKPPRVKRENLKVDHRTIGAKLSTAANQKGLKITKALNECSE